MNTSAIPAFIADLEKRGEDPSAGSQQFFALIGAAVADGRIKPQDVYYGLAEGAKSSLVLSSLYRLQGYCVEYLTPAGAIVLMGLGVFQGLQTIKNATAGALSLARESLELFSNPAATVSSWALKLFGSTKSDTATASSALSTVLVSIIPGPIMAVILALMNAPATLPGTTVGSNTGTSSNLTTPPPANQGSNTTLAQAITNAILQAVGATGDSARYDRVHSAVRKELSSGTPRRIARDRVAKLVQTNRL